VMISSFLYVEGRFTTLSTYSALTIRWEYPTHNHNAENMMIRHFEGSLSSLDQIVSVRNFSFIQRISFKTRVWLFHSNSSPACNPSMALKRGESDETPDCSIPPIRRTLVGTATMK
jgi:hypothetical protein